MNTQVVVEYVCMFFFLRFLVVGARGIYLFIFSFFFSFLKGRLREDITILYNIAFERHARVLYYTHIHVQHNHTRGQVLR